MSDFIKSSFWNLFGNVFARVLSFITIPFLANYYSKGDIAIYKSLQSVLLLVFAIIPMGINLLYLAEEKSVRGKYWNLLVFTTSFFGAVFLGVLYFLKDRFFAGVPLGGVVFAIIACIEVYKVFLITRLMGDIKFKQITIAMISRQTVLNVVLISFAFIKSILPILIGALLISEIIEVAMLSYFCNKSGRLLVKPIKQNTIFDKKAKKFMLLSGGEALLVNLALQLPNIIVLTIMGKDLAVEFQMPLVLTAVPAVMIMKSVASVMLPYLSNNRDNKIIHEVINNLHYIFIILGMPIYFGISFFSHEISGFMFNPDWENAYIALKYFPIFMVVNMLQSPLSGLALLKNKPEIGFVYAFSLLSVRLLSLIFGFQFYGFLGAIVAFTLCDTLTRMIRLKVDLSIVSYKMKSLMKNTLKPILLSISAIITCVVLFHIGLNKFVCYFLSWSIFATILFLWDKERILKYIFQLKNGLAK